MMNFQDRTQSIVAVGGFSSDAGKTTLMCELLRRLPNWEAIKMTRGHYRSCGKDPHACCVSHLLSDRPMIRSGRAETDTRGKDTGRYWEAGAANVHWVIVTDEQVEQGIKLALERVEAAGVLIEGNSFQQFVEVDYALMVTRATGGKVKATARRALPKSSALYLFEDNEEDADAPQRFKQWRAANAAEDALIGALPIYTRDDLPLIVEQIQTVQAHRANNLTGALLV
jgi:molybdopterin-guanine dinucleotide biosynthesis protein